MSRPRRKLLFIANHVGTTGGMELYGRRLVAGAAEQGWDVTVLASAADLPPGPGLRFQPVPGPVRPFTLANPWFLAQVAIRAKRSADTVVHTNGALHPGGADVATLHFCHLAAGGVSRASRATAAHKLNQRLAGALARQGERWILTPARTPRIIALSGAVREDAQRLLGYSEKAVTLIPHGVDARRFRPDTEARVQTRRELGLSSDALVAVFVGGDWRRKGLDHALRGVAGRRAWNLLVVGRGDERALRKDAQEIGVSSRLRVAGARTDVERWLAAADAFVLPTEYETFCFAAHEAAACGLPIVAPPTGGIDGLLDAGGGISIERTAAAVESALETLESPATRSRLGLAARRYTAGLTWERSVAAHLALYQEILELRHALA